MIFQLSTPYTDPTPSKSPPPKFRNFTFWLYLTFLIMWSFCLRCYKHGIVLFSRWWLVNASYTAWLDFLATAGLLAIFIQATLTTSALRLNTISPLLQFLGFLSDLLFKSYSRLCWVHKGEHLRTAATGWSPFLPPYQQHKSNEWK